MQENNFWDRQQERWDKGQGHKHGIGKIKGKVHCWVFIILPIALILFSGWEEGNNGFQVNE